MVAPVLINDAKQEGIRDRKVRAWNRSDSIQKHVRSLTNMLLNRMDVIKTLINIILDQM